MTNPTRSQPLPPPSSDLQVRSHEAIAIVGIGCRFPGGAHGPEGFWRTVMAGVDAIERVDDQRWSRAKHVHPSREARGKTYAEWGGFIEGALEFDAEFFGLTPREVQSMDPQQRVVLQTFVEAMRDAGVVLGELRGTDTAVYMGGFTLDHLVARLNQASLDEVDAYVATGSMMTLIANRLSYLFGLEGPSMVLDTACSSSLVATHLAVQSLISGECRLAVAGGVNLMLEPGVTVAESKAGMLSPTGRCRSFSADADGYVRAEGCGLVVLKRLDAALVDGDRIYALIRSTAVNQDGHSAGQTVPSGEAQARLVRAACRKAGIEPHTLDYVEAHGTGTPVGDPIEARALGSALGEGRPADQPCLIASVKTCFGHSEAAAGVAGLIKTALALHHGALPPHLHAREPNPAIDFEALGLELVGEARPWPERGFLRLAAVNSFGFGGTNAHAILSSVPATEPARAPRPGQRRAGVLAGRHIYAASAHCEAALDRFNAELAPADAELPFAAVCARQLRLTDALALGQFVIAEDHAAAMAKIHAGAYTRVRRGSEPGPLAFVLSGMGPQWWAMGQQLARHSPVYREAIAECDAAFAVLTGRWRLGEELDRDEASSRMAETAIAQPANFAVQIGLARVLEAWGVVPELIVGHSVGETAAAYLAGALSLADAATVVFHRSRLQATRAGTGSMLAVGLSIDDVRERIAGRELFVSIAAVNSPAAVTLAGDAPTLAALAEQLSGEGVFAKALRVEVPYHSPQMDPVRDEFLASVAGIEPRTPSRRLLSTVTGTEVRGPSLDPEYWWQNLRAPVVFADACRELFELGARHFVELGPHPVLSQSIQQLAEAADGALDVVTIPTLRRKTDELDQLLGALASVHLSGGPVDWSRTYPEIDKRVCRGAYPWVRRTFPSLGAGHRRHRNYFGAHPLLGARLDHPTPTWETELSCARLAYLRDHVIDGAMVVPGAVFVEMARAAGRELYGAAELAIVDLRLDRAVFLDADRVVRLVLTIERESGAFSIRSRSEAEWLEHVHGRLEADVLDVPARAELELPDEAEVHRDCYTAFARVGFEYGPAFRLIETARSAGTSVHTRLRVGAEAQAYLAHPTLIDALFHSALVSVTRTFMPTGIDALRCVARPSDRLDCFVEVRDEGHESGEFRADIFAYCAQTGRPLAHIEGFRARALSGRERVPIPRRQWLHHGEWRAASPERLAPTPSHLLLLVDDDGHGRALQAALEAQGHTLTCVSGRACRDEAGLRAAIAEPARLDAVVVASTLAHREAPATPAALERLLDHGVRPLRAISQAIQADQPAAKLWLVTPGIQPIPGHPLRPGLAELLGWARVFGFQEQPRQWGGAIDLDVGADPADAHASGVEVAAALIGANASQACEWAVRGGQTYRATWVRSEVGEQALAMRLRAEETHWITGGLGALGLIFADHLVERGARHLTLFSRRSLPPRDQWATLAVDAPERATLEALRALEARGARVHVSQADISDPAALAGELDGQARRGWPALRGVIHSAGVLRDGPISTMSAGDLDAVLAPKVAGAWALDRATRGEALRFFVLFSSVASVLATAGQANYAAANAAMDQLAHARHRLGLPATSINWGPWAEVGMASARGLEDYFARIGVHSLPPGEAVLALEQALASGHPQLMIAALDWGAIDTMYPAGVPGSIEALVAQSRDAHGSETIDLDALAALDGPAQRDALADHLVELVAQVMQIDPAGVGVDMGLNELGVDSLLATELSLAINRRFDAELPLVALLDGSSFTELAGRVIQSWRVRRTAALRTLGPTLSLDLIEAADPEYGSTCDLVQTCYELIYGATIEVHAEQLIVLREQGRVVAAMALSSAGQRALFSERYLPRPADELIAEAESTSVRRDQIAEVGTFAALSTDFAFTLFELTPQLARALGHDYLLMTASRYIQPLLSRSEAEFRPLCVASVAALEPAERARWGSFYAGAPRTGYLDLDALAASRAFDLETSASPELLAKLAEVGS